MFQRFLRWRRGGRSQSAPPSPVIPQPPTPPGWHIVPTATPGVTSYEVSARFDEAAPRTSPDRIGSIEFVGTNSTEFCGFPPDTLQIGAVNLRFDTATREKRLSLRFDYRAEGWQRLAFALPSCDFNRLPLVEGGE